MNVKTAPLSLGELGPEERAALIEAGELEAGPDDEGYEAAGDDANNADDEGQDAGTEGDDEGAGGSEANDDGQDDAAAAAGNGDAAAQGDADDGAKPPQQSAPPRPAPPDHTARLNEIDDRVKAITDERAALRKQLDEGDIRMAEYLEKSDALADESADLRSERRDLQSDTQRVQRDAETDWAMTQQRIFGEPENEMFREGVDPPMRAALGAQLEILGREYQEKGVDPGGEAILREAIAKVRERFGIKPADDGKPPPRNTRAERGKQQAEQQGKAPKTLAAVPAAAESDEALSDDEFAELDAMLGDPDRMLEAEARIARMPYHEQVRFGMVNPR